MAVAAIAPHVLRRSLGLAFIVAALLPAVGSARELVTSARFSEPTERYAHGVLGDTIEYGALEITSGESTLTGSTAQKPSVVKVRLPLNRVFEDIKPRLLDVTGDGKPEVIIVETHVNKGAQLAVYSGKGRKLASTPHIGQRNRWLAPIGAADLDGDGHIEIAYIDRPHLARTLRIWRYRRGQLTEVAALKGLTNHKIGWDFIASGLRNCSNIPEIITADAGWKRIMATRFDGAKISTQSIGHYTGPSSITAAFSCSE